VLGLTTGGGKEGIKERGLNSTVKQHLSLRDSAEVFIALTHIGLKRDYTTCSDFPEIDVIVGGHSHDLLETAVLSNSVLIAHAGGNPHFASDQYPVYLGKIVLTLENGIVTEKKGRVIEILRKFSKSRRIRRGRRILTG
jgi:2',3'-cyclic-nucleotide 2'-phosphodiesterase (5'-nucleotidase family)